MTVTLTKSLTIDELLAKADGLAALPQVVMRVIDLTAMPNATAAELEKAISLDQALAAKILGLANSSYYGLPRRLSSLREAVVFLGFKAVRNLAMTITTFSMFLGKGDTLSLARRTLWRHSLDAAQCARIVTSRLPRSVRDAVSGDEAFTCGLLHDIGKMLLDSGQHQIFVQIVQSAACQKKRFYELETDFLPFGHSLVGAALVREWNLPPSVCETIAFHHTPRAAEINPRLTAVVALANELSHFLDDGGVDEDALRVRSEDILSPLRLTLEALPGLADACRIELDKGLSQCSFG